MWTPSEGEYKALDMTFKVWATLHKNGRYNASIRRGDGLGEGLAFSMGNIPMKGGGGSSIAHFPQGSHDIEAVVITCGTYMDLYGN